MLAAARIRRPPSGGRFLFGLGEAQTWVLVVAIVVIVLLVVYLNRRR